MHQKQKVILSSPISMMNEYSFFFFNPVYSHIASVKSGSIAMYRLRHSGMKEFSQGA